MLFTILYKISVHIVKTMFIFSFQSVTLARQILYNYTFHLSKRLIYFIIGYRFKDFFSS
jgi:Na+-transporting NADH:ubiquinone oxidoreductase subunit NqrD